MFRIEEAEVTESMKGSLKGCMGSPGEESELAYFLHQARSHWSRYAIGHPVPRGHLSDLIFSVLSAFSAVKKSVTFRATPWLILFWLLASD